MSVPKRFHDPSFREQARAILTSDMVQRRERKWPLREVDINGQNHDDMRDDFLALPFILDKYRGKLTVCGGLATILVSRRLHIPNPVDADLFFHNVTTEEANEILEDCVAFIVTVETCPENYIRIERRQFVTNVVIQRGTIGTDNAATWTSVYQFVHRIYPSLDSVLGGFDIPLCMFAYDGQTCWGTEMAIWSLENKCIVADTTRRSTSYEHRLRKYVSRYDFEVFFPGLSYSDIQVEKNRTQLARSIFHLIEEQGFCIKRDRSGDEQDFDWLKRHITKANGGKRFNHICLNYEGKVEELRKSLDNPSRIIYNLKKYSDYSDCRVWSKDIAEANATMLRCNNFEGILVYHEYLPQDRSVKDPRYLNEDSEDDPDPTPIRHVRKEQQVREDFRRLVAKPVIKFALMKEFGLGTERRDLMTIKRLGIFGHSDLFARRHTPTEIAAVLLEINQYLEKEAKRMTAVFTGITWITDNPGRQWTSSCNPIMENPRKFYGDDYVPFLIGIPEKIETTLRLGRLDKDSMLGLLPRDVLNIVLKFVAHQYTYKEKARKVKTVESPLTNLVIPEPSADAKQTVSKIFDLVKKRRDKNDW